MRSYQVCRDDQIGLVPFELVHHFDSIGLILVAVDEDRVEALLFEVIEEIFSPHFVVVEDDGLLDAELLDNRDDCLALELIG